jgi:deoxyribodipyrimidine photo-lyase
VNQLVNDVGLLWFRVGDLRLTDNPALNAALADGPAVPFFAWTPSEDGTWAPGAASRWWLHRSLAQLARSLEERGSRLIIRSGVSIGGVLARLAADSGATRIYFNRGYTPAERLSEASIERTPLRSHSFNSRLLVEASQVRRQSEQPFRVFSAFWRSTQPDMGIAPPAPAPRCIPGPLSWPASEPLQALGLEPVPDWAAGLRSTWQPGELNALRAQARFMDSGLPRYQSERDLPDHEGTSRLSPYLHFGEVGPRQVWVALQRRLETTEPGSALARSIEVLRRELGWREFAAYALYQRPHLSEQSLDPAFDDLDWATNVADARAWQRGRTGYPLIDAGMRQLWQTGWMHNRVRMVVASFFVKDLLLRWQDGARWFWDTLVDADLANNTLGWQWSAGCGPDAAPFSRIFNPTLQAQRFDPSGGYIRRFVPELSRLAAPYVHAPWMAPPLVLAEAGVTLGRTYPWPIVDHAVARRRAVGAFARRELPTVTHGGVRRLHAQTRDKAVTKCVSLVGSW